MNLINRFFLLIFVHISCFGLDVYGQNGQVNIPRIELMPDQPAPYNLLNWKKIAQQYDSFVYDVSKTGVHLPLTSIGNSGINYPGNKTIKMHTYVGTASPSGSEAINVLPSLVGASLVGINKGNQFGQNWLTMSQDFFNKANSENIYLNNAGSSSGSDWWYDLMPNLFFYQLYNLYPDLGQEANSQFNSIADRFLSSVKAMGASNTPWVTPEMNYRAWKFKTMEPNASGVKEPEAAGAYAWVLYHAWKQTGNLEYLLGAEWAIEFLNQYAGNPSYELQLPYGTYIAAKMNAELGTSYDIAKMVNWSFDRGSLRGWGTIVGKWGGFDVSGLVGEANDRGDDYAFQLNGVQQAAALVPMVRYDKRFAKAIGKWVLNLANATRLFYPGYLPDRLQDASAWSSLYDPNQVIGYEALREKWQGVSPFSTGDALKGGWASTNLALYGSSSIGFLGSIIEVTNVEKILRLDVLKTDFFKGKAYPTYLYYNPYSSNQSIEFSIGSSNVDIYEALSETFIHKKVSGKINLMIPAHQAILVSVLPAEGKQTFNRHQMIINDVVVDYRQSSQNYTKPVRIKALASKKPIIQVGDSTLIYATANDPDGGVIDYAWSTTRGTIIGTKDQVMWHASVEGISTIQVIAIDNEGNRDTASIDLSVVKKINVAPRINELRKNNTYIETNGKIQFDCLATDANEDSLGYQWTINGGTLNNNSTASVTWTAPTIEGIYTVSVQVMDHGNLMALASTTILVKNFTSILARLIAYYPFTGSAIDVSGNQLHGEVRGTVYVPDRMGSPDKACYFNGGAQHINVPNSPVLNVQDAISVSCWFNAARLPDKETFLLSHGSWQNRWKISFTPEKKLRWTINTLNTIADLDAPSSFAQDSFYHITATYDGMIMALYLNGSLIAYRTLSGQMRTTILPFLMGQMIPSDATYNFKGIIDEVKLFDQPLNPKAAAGLYQESITALQKVHLSSISSAKISPNPVIGMITIIPPAEYKADYQLRILSIHGSQILLKNLDSNDKVLTFDTSSFTPGIYVILLQNDKQMTVGRFIKL